VPPSDSGGALVCEAGLARCANACVIESAEQCGDSCISCFALVPAPPTNGAAACIVGSCGFECDAGYLKCSGEAACCTTSALATGDAFTCAVLSTGEARCWGANEAGQLGGGAVSPNRPSPGAVALSAAASGIGAGATHACAILASGGVECWGANGAGQVKGSSSSVSEATPVPSPVTAGATAVVAGAAHTCALVGGAVRCWGDPANNKLGGIPDASGAATAIPSGVSSLAAGRNHTCALLATGAVRCWGDGTAGQLGGAPDGAGLSTPFSGGMALLSARWDQTCASSGLSSGVDPDTVVQCWGSGLGAQFGLSVPQPFPTPPLKDATATPQRAVIDKDIEVLAVGRRHACVQRTGGSFAECFGVENDRGQLGAPNVPVGSSGAFAVSGNLVTAEVAVGPDHTCARLTDGTLRCWGANGSGQLGIGNLVDPPVGDVVAPSGR
jgi:hypothetical protein